MKKIVLTVAVVLASLTSNAQTGILTISKNDKQIPVDFWYVVKDDKELNNQMIYYSDTTNAKTVLGKILKENNLDINKPSGIDEAKDPYWIIAYPSGYVSYFYLSPDKGDVAYSWITVVSK